MRTILMTACAVMLVVVLACSLYGYFLFLCVKGKR
jgi:hypothetical protein